ncbi:uncharacterized protein MONOS_5901 [Monocercomonoides exilis]|uniref:uncharacterized protein n=1 Tax=Monocercomonoides exilis TaxID=2049356 RepID=UPI00355AAE27|nr:hypothetical protein MONOS_5901 [Monocercomonoides exilis]|eukprot:MONOS_5901.1-p1 / transcript=MONOS_5901.1 / gene=MONOS_5901 / organism=Monocercomonoides_exilis_PA203 / gene_product=unspecified product / transcript_product=unspecified product / location=Mono_scaffold00178:20825-21387(+) / protein_length=86 / sequence_SO=supercontig / SO=protein_coding / is_pseudo=false
MKDLIPSRCMLCAVLDADGSDFDKAHPVLVIMEDDGGGGGADADGGGVGGGGCGNVHRHPLATSPPFLLTAQNPSAPSAPPFGAD